MTDSYELYSFSWKGDNGRTCEGCLVKVSRRGLNIWSSSSGDWELSVGASFALVVDAELKLGLRCWTDAARPMLDIATGGCVLGFEEADRVTLDARTSREAAVRKREPVLSTPPALLLKLLRNCEDEVEARRGFGVEPVLEPTVLCRKLSLDAEGRTEVDLGSVEADVVGLGRLDVGLGAGSLDKRGRALVRFWVWSMMAVALTFSSLR
jgi:hypothetical protein